MSINNIKNRLKQTSKKDATWIKNAKYRKENEDWLDISFAIAVKVMSALKANKTANAHPNNQKELAAALACTPQYVNKLLKGTENLQLETISKIESILNINLIEVPQFENTVAVEVEEYTYYQKSKKVVGVGSSSSSLYEALYQSYTYNKPDCPLKLVA